MSRHSVTVRADDEADCVCGWVARTDRRNGMDALRLADNHLDAHADEDTDPWVDVK